MKCEKKYIKKPIIISAVKIEKEMEVPGWFHEEIMKGNIKEMKFPGWFREEIKKGNIRELPCTLEFSIKTLEGTMLAKEGDYVIKGIKGEVYPCKADIFEASYEEVSE
jgi:hypothetical protein